ncbi:hypothetical protein ACFWP7_14315 [Streptomyces sp. NPDC058470]|uniref:hypothetical protein n=1 Tax=Streptomyces sp. NPDC058470 TaxID=3346515 RepID=UPI0036628258
MGEAVLLILGAVLGYFGHVGQERYTHKQQQKADDVAQMKALHAEFIKLRDLWGDQRQALHMASTLEGQVALLRNAKLRKRVLLDLDYARDAIVITPADERQRARKVWTQDALDCLAAVARGSRLPEPGDDYNTHLFFLDRMGARLAPSLSRITDALAENPELVALVEERNAWEKRRRAHTGWRRILFWQTRR